MSDDTKERRCKYCGKLLIDEKLFCRRCVLEGRNKAGKFGSSSVFAGALLGAISLLNNNSGSNDDV